MNNAKHRGAGSVIKFVELTGRRSGRGESPTGFRRQRPWWALWGTKFAKAKGLRKVHFFVVMTAETKNRKFYLFVMFLCLTLLKRIP